ncbi:hypothetical protein OQA88_5224 [Cercophora sp. LCS_1]
MAPLGIVTAVVGAIRVGGPSWLKAIIGRARESRAVAESEVMGSGPIREFVVLVPDEADVGMDEIEIVDIEDYDSRYYLDEYDPSFRERIANKLSQHSQDSERAGNRGIVVIRNTAAATPNMTLNVDNQVGRGEMYAVAVFGVVLQLGVLVYAGFAAYYILSFQGEGSAYGFPCTLAGTLLLVTGMILCASVVEGICTVSAAQLGAIVIMTILRTLIRRNLAKAAKGIPLNSDHALDWLTLALGNTEAAPWSKNLGEKAPSWETTPIQDPVKS